MFTNELRIKIRDDELNICLNEVTLDVKFILFESFINGIVT